jgi:hypothetical protein
MAAREAPAQAELRPACAGVFCVNLHLFLALFGFRRKSQPSRLPAEILPQIGYFDGLIFHITRSADIRIL